MHRLFYAVLSSLLALACCSTPARATQFRLLAWGTNDYSLHFDQKDNLTIDVQVQTNRLSPVYETPGGQSLTLYRIVNDDKGMPVRQIACPVTVPAGLRHGILILIPAAPASSWIRLGQGGQALRVPRTYEYRWLDDSPEVRPPGTIEFRNMQGLPVAVRAGDREMLVPPQGKEQVPIVPGAKRIGFKAAAFYDGGWHLFASSPLPTRGVGRLMVIFREAAEAPATGASGPGIRIVQLHEPPSRLRNALPPEEP
ncbi:MAG: hypothetical protein LBK99_10865 [Opitutaceae bacterium]|jgi:hypothetical protein|nr:hypothetical protein [Opitutaceae bacterium]